MTVSPHRFVLAVTLLLAGLCGPMLSQQFQAPSLNRLPPGELLSEDRSLLPQGVKLRSVYPPGIKVTKLSEGWVPHLYDDTVRYCTIGYGHLIKKAPCDGTESVEFRDGLTKPRGEEILAEDLASSQYCVMTSVRVPLTDGQFAALTDFVFNVGSANFRSSKLLEIVNAKQQDQVPSQLRRWVLAGGRPLVALKTRREREVKLFFEGLPITKAIPQQGEDLSPIEIRTGQSTRRQ